MGLNKSIVYVNKKGKVSEHSTATASEHSSGERSEDNEIGELLQKLREQKKGAQKSEPVRVKIERPSEEKTPQQRDVLPSEMSFFEYPGVYPETPKTIKKRYDDLGINISPKQIQKVVDKLSQETPPQKHTIEVDANQLKEVIDKLAKNPFTDLRLMLDRQTNASDDLKKA